MPKPGPLQKANILKDVNGEFTYMTTGQVVDTNDPQQMGRLRVACPLLGDSGTSTIEDIPWATYVSPLGGTTVSPSRGREDNVQTAGQLAYGMFNIPKVGSTVLIACIDADPRFRIWLGCLHDQFMTHTMPHGRYSYKTEGQPEGPFSSSEDKIQPLYDSQTSAFTGDAGIDPRTSYEFRTRGADVSVSGVGEEFVNIEESTVTLLSDDVAEEYTEGDGTTRTNTQGYPKSRVEPDLPAANTGGDLYDPQTYSWTTPGFHGMSMSDNAENCRIRFRTTHGHQIIMDDTNERIYISTAGGKTWIEMDEVGNIDIFGERSISVHAKKDINFNADGTFRVNAGGIHMSSTGEFRVHAGEDLHLKTDLGMFLHSEDDSSIKVAGGTMYIETFVDLDMKATGNLVGDGGGTASLLAGGNVLLTGAQVHLNGPPAPSGSGVPVENTKNAFLTSRVPDHEPWARTMMKSADSDKDTGNIHTPEFAYDSPDIGRKENDEDLGRNPKWHR